MDFLSGYAPLLDPQYWFNPRPVPLGPSLVSGILAFFVWFLLLAAVLALIARGLKAKDPLKAGLVRRFAPPLTTTGLLGLLVLFLTYEQVPFFGMRFWFLLVLLVFLGLLIRAIVYAVRDYPARRADRDERQRLAKYLPGRK